MLHLNSQYLYLFNQYNYQWSHTNLDKCYILYPNFHWQCNCFAFKLSNWFNCCQIINYKIIFTSSYQWHSQKIVFGWASEKVSRHKFYGLPKSKPSLRKSPMVGATSVNRADQEYSAHYFTSSQSQKQLKMQHVTSACYNGWILTDIQGKTYFFQYLNGGKHIKTHKNERKGDL